MTAKPDDARMGLNLLLSFYPGAEVAYVMHQRHNKLGGEFAQVESYGPWTCVDLVHDGERRQYAIWNYNGDVYRVTGPEGQYPGAVEDDPFLTVHARER
jgi:hypothetical protein